MSNNNVLVSVTGISFTTNTSNVSMVYMSNGTTGTFNISIPSNGSLTTTIGTTNSLQINQQTQSVVLNATSTTIGGPTGGLYVAPISSYSGSSGPFKNLLYGSDYQVTQGPVLNYTLLTDSSNLSVTPTSIKKIAGTSQDTVSTMEKYQYPYLSFSPSFVSNGTVGLGTSNSSLYGFQITGGSVGGGSSVPEPYTISAPQRLVTVIPDRTPYAIFTFTIGSTISVLRERTTTSGSSTLTSNFLPSLNNEPTTDGTTITIYGTISENSTKITPGNTTILFDFSNINSITIQYIYTDYNFTTISSASFAVSYIAPSGSFVSTSGSGTLSTIKPIVNGVVQSNSTSYTNQLLSIEIKPYGINYYINSTIFYTIPAVSLANYNAYFNLYSINDSISSINYGNSSTTNYFNSLSVSSTGIYLGQNVGTNGAVNIGYNAGQTNQGTGSIAIGYNAGPTGMTSNSIALNASGVPLSATGPTGGFYVAPVASYSGSQGPFTILAYGVDNQIVTVTGTVLTSLNEVGANMVTGGTGYFNYINVAGLNAISVTGSTGYYNYMSVTGMNVLTTTGSTGYYNYMSVTGMNVLTTTGSTGYYNYLSVTGMNVLTTTGSTGYFNYMSVTGLNVLTTTGSTGYYNYLSVTGMNVLTTTGSTGYFNYLSVTGMNVLTTTGSTGYYNYMSVTGMNVLTTTGSTGYYNYMSVTGMNVLTTTGSTGYYNYMSVTGMNVLTTTGSTGYFNYMSVTGMNVLTTTGSTGYYNYLSVTGMNVLTTTGSTGYYNYMSINSTGIYLGQNVGQTGAVNIGYKAGQYAQGTGSIAIGYLAGPSGMSSNSIALNASGTGLYATGPTGGFYVAPVASYSGSQGPFTLLAYGADNQIVTVTGATGLNLSLSTPTVTYDSWILTNLYGQPTPPTNANVTPTTTDIYITFSYPLQYQLGMFPNPSPLITSAYANYYTSDMTSTITTNGVTGTSIYAVTEPNNINSQYVKANMSQTGVIQGIHFYNYKNDASNTLNKTITYITNYGTMYNYYVTSTSMIYAYIWYTNYSSLSPNVLTTFGKYLVQGAPSNVTFTASPGSTHGTYQITVTVTLPSPFYADSNLSYVNGAKYNGYNYYVVYTYTYTAISNTVRYVTSGATFDSSTDSNYTSLKDFTSSGTVGSLSTIIPLYPDTTYNVNLSVINDLNKVTPNSTASSSNPISVTTQGFDYTTYISSTNISGTFGLTLPTNVSAKLVNDNTIKTNVLTTYNNPITGSATYLVNNSYKTRGTLGNVIVTISPPGTTATATATVVDGKITGINLNSVGSNYVTTSTPTVTITGGGGNGATATANVSGGTVSSINLIGGGSGYSIAPTVTISPPGTTATATATVVDGKITAITLNGGGSNYVTTSTPTVTITGGDGSGANATANVSGGTVSSITLNNAGSGYALVTGITTTIVGDNSAYFANYSSNPHTFGGWGATDSWTGDNNITMTPGSMVDLYTETTNTGYYGTKTVSFSTITKNIITAASPVNYSATIIGTYPSNNVGTSSTSINYGYTSSNNFYYDGENSTPSTPVITSFTINSTTLGTNLIQVCGVYMLYGNIPFTVTTTNVYNVGKYFYNNNNILKYTTTTNNGLLATSYDETSLANVINSGTTATTTTATTNLPTVTLTLSNPLIIPGLIVTGTGIPVGTTVISFDSNKLLTLSQSATIAVSSTLTFSKGTTATTTTATNNSTSVTLTLSNPLIIPGLIVTSSTSGTTIPVGTTVISFNNTTLVLTLSQTATIAVSSTLTFSTGTTGTTGTTTNNSTTVTLTSLNPGIVPGLIVTGTGIPVGTTVVSFDSNKLLTLSQNASIAASSTLTFAKTSIAIDTNNYKYIVGSLVTTTTTATTTNNSTSVTLTSSNPGIVPGLIVTSSTSGTTIPVGTTVVSCNNTTLLLSQSASIAASSTLLFSIATPLVFSNNSIIMNNATKISNFQIKSTAYNVAGTSGTGSNTSTSQEIIYDPLTQATVTKSLVLSTPTTAITTIATTNLTTVTLTSSNTLIIPGLIVTSSTSGTTIPVGTTVVSFDSNKLLLTLSQSATIAASSTLTFAPVGYRLFSTNTAGNESVSGTVTANNILANYMPNYISGQFDNSSSILPVSLGTSVSAGYFVTGTTYMITSLGTTPTNFTLIGASANTVGTIFTATGIGAGTGNASQITGVVSCGSFVSGSTYIITSSSTGSTFPGASATTVGTIFTATGAGTSTITAGTAIPLISIPATSIISGSTYIITSSGTGSTFPGTSPSSTTVGTIFTATATGTGTGTAILVIPATSMNAGSTYIITSVGTTLFTQYGAISNITGTIFIATGVGSGTGTVSLLSQQQSDMMVSNGYYTTSLLAYADYTTIYYNQTLKNKLKYSSITSGYRYATFAWKLDYTQSGKNVTNNLISINFVTINLNNSSTLYANSDGTSMYTNNGITNKLYLYYRFEDTANSMNWSSGGTISTPWIDGNSYDTTYNTTYGNNNNLNVPTPLGNTTQTTKTLSGLTTAFATNSNSTNTSFTVKLPNPISTYNTNTNIYFYCRIGAIIADSFSFGNPTATLPSNQTISAGYPSIVTLSSVTAGTTRGIYQLNAVVNTPTPYYSDTNLQYGYVNGSVVGPPVTPPVTPSVTYNYWYTPVSNSVRYGGVYNTTLQTFTSSSTSITSANSYTSSVTTNVYPDTVYAISNVSVTNGTLTTPSSISNYTITAGSFVSGTTYMITSLGTGSTFPGASTSSIGTIFTATSGGTSGTTAGTAVEIVSLSAGSFVSGTTYMITSLGTGSTFPGASANTVGTIFTATGSGTGTGTAVVVIKAGSFVSGTTYIITSSTGSTGTDFTLIGASANTVGTIFTATGIGAGTCTATLIALLTPATSGFDISALKDTNNNAYAYAITSSPALTKLGANTYYTSANPAAGGSTVTSLLISKNNPMSSTQAINVQNSFITRGVLGTGTLVTVTTSLLNNSLSVDTITSQSTGTITSGSKSLTLTTSNTNIIVGCAVSGSGILVGTTVSAVNSGTSFTLSQNATATASGVTLTFTTGISIGGFGSTIPGTNPTTNNYLTITPSTSTDLGTNQYAGYYQQNTITISTGSGFSNLTASANPYSIQMVAAYPNTNGNATVTYTTPNFYYDGEMQTATCSISSFTLNQTDFTSIGASSNSIGTIFTATGAGTGTGTGIALVSTATTAGLFVTNTTYVITSLGTTDFTSIGASSNAIGTIFTATGAGTGTGTGIALVSTATTAGLFVTNTKYVITSLGDFTPICGIYVYTPKTANTITFNSTVNNVTNLGNNFYNATNTIVYSVSLDGTTYSSPNVSTEITKATSYNRSSNTIVYNTPTVYTKLPITLKATPYNITTAGTAATTSISIIYDPLSVGNLITIIPYVSTNPVIGCRIWSGLTTSTLGQEMAATTTLNTLSNSGTSFSSTIYDNSKSIIDSNGNYKYELLFANNTYTNYNIYVIDYSSYNNNSVNYSTLNTTGLSVNYTGTSTSYRYATFAWKVDINNLNAAGYKNITFTLNNVSSTSSLTTDANSGSLLLGSYRLPLFYRVEDSTAITTFVTSTPWINGNLYNAPTQISSSNFNSTTTNYTGLLSNTAVSINGDNSITFNVILGNGLKNSSPQTTYIYARIAIPTGIQFSFTNINCKLY